MKNKLGIIVIIVLVIVFGLLCYFYFKDSGTVDYSNYSKENNNETSTDSTFTTTSSVSSALTEDIPLRTGYYFQEMLVEDNVVIKKGAKIIKYTNGKYLVAPYDLIITDASLPNSKKIVNSSHKITVSAYNVLSAEFRVSESKIDSISIGKTVKVKVPALNDVEVEGIITDISNTATNGRFMVTVEFDNNGDIKIGMTVNITI